MKLINVSINNKMNEIRFPRPRPVPCKTVCQFHHSGCTEQLCAGCMLWLVTMYCVLYHVMFSCTEQNYRTSTLI
jgi:hypothetical protein